MCGPGSGSGTLLDGGVSEWPKEHASKACDGLRRPRVQIPPPPPTLLKRRRGPLFAGLSCGWLLGFAGRAAPGHQVHLHMTREQIVALADAAFKAIDA